jgi:mannan endo-1,4-beta-mannosidase
MMKRVRFIIPLLVFIVFCATAVATNISVTYTIKTDSNRTPISPYIYGTNWGNGADYTIGRSGGNRLTAYNWENNFSNAGADWWWHNDNYMSSSLTPGKAITDFRDSCITNHQESIVTLQMAGYVSDSITGYVDCNTQAAPSYWFKKVVFAKGAPFCNPPGNPITTDANVYMDEFVNFLVSRYGHAGEANGVKFYDLDNEPDIWFEYNSPPPKDPNYHGTHWEVHPNAKCSCRELTERSVPLSIAVKNVDPNAQILGPVSYGFNGFHTFQDANDWGSLQNGYNWFLDYYLDRMEANSVAAGKRLLDVLDVHWYPEAQDGAGNRITNTVRTTAMFNARMQAPRTLWDPGYVWPNGGEISWINQQWFADHLPILPELFQSINNYYPGTKLAITEFDYGDQNNFSGGIATTDVLGIFGKYGVYISNYWGGGEEANYVHAAYNIYRNYDGSHSKFGDTNVPAGMSDKVNSSVYASITDTSASELHLIVINKNLSNAISGTFNINSQRNYSSASVWKFDNYDCNIIQTTGISYIADNTFTYTIPPMTVCHIVLPADCPPWDLNFDCHVNIEDFDTFADWWLDPVNFVNFVDFASFAQEFGW